MKQLILILFSLSLFSCDVLKQVTTPAPDVPVLPAKVKPVTVYVHDTLFVHDTVVTPIAENLVALNVLSPDFSPEVNSDNIENYLSALPEGSGKSLYVPGEIHFARSLKIYRRPIHLIGDNGSLFSNGTRFYFPAGSDGIVYERDNTSLQDVLIENVCVISSNRDGQNKGFNLTGRFRLLFCSAKGFGYGFYATGGVPYSDVSGSLFSSCIGAENGTNYYVQGGDANAILFINCDARDAKEYNYRGDSFLGGTWISCMAHASGKGDWYLPAVVNGHQEPNNNARNVLWGCYSEGGSPKSIITRYTTVVGGTWGTGFKLESDDAATDRHGNFIPLEGYQDIDYKGIHPG